MNRFFILVFGILSVATLSIAEPVTGEPGPCDEQAMQAAEGQYLNSDGEVSTHLISWEAGNGSAVIYKVLMESDSLTYGNGPYPTKTPISQVYYRVALDSSDCLLSEPTTVWPSEANP